MTPTAEGQRQAGSRKLRHAIEVGDLRAVQAALARMPALANTAIRWGPNGSNVTDPLHFVSDCCFEGTLHNGTEADIARALLDAGASPDGNDGRESPLIGATSLGVPTVAQVLVEAGARLDVTALFGATALHWAAYMGLDDTVALLVDHGADPEATCTEFRCTPLFWAVQGYARLGPSEGRLAAASVLLDAGSDPTATNIEGATALQRAAEASDSEMHELLESRLAN